MMHYTRSVPATLMIAASLAVASAANIPIESFSDPVHTWNTMNDPVMGGESSSSLSLDREHGTLIFSGEVAIVPYLGVPGFILAYADDGPFPDVSSCAGLRLRIAAEEEYKGYRLSFGYRHLPGGGHAYGYKADFDAPVGVWGDVFVPFENFTASWDEASGDPIVTCGENPDFCPDEETLRDMRTISIWGEGVAGNETLYIESIGGTRCDESDKNQDLESTIMSAAAD
eukprot:CAMPEP_0113296992 /NCGR_PEP_ID=MMETSP0010_2-20120614/43_1 /TAXON_ID=216773 ORGANISM="Corethron hystrix, Strain 308" /NCGR_SAMPLE_ID=MMETSP0010_2 /ASSEMBLY_ACC=CAM_ASM_000155 /LENGTH=227 /DNA_ID=CAMNT_0000149813 /DNA_START=1 /DNA_END=684 /DNA_ORIENTATION=+ /assembly_acc=CAM_ASM_000155